MTPETLSAISGIVISLAFSYIPGFAAWYQPLAATKKRLLMLTTLTLSSVAAFGLACAGIAPRLGLALVCDESSLIELARTLIAALVANQATFAISPRPAPPSDEPTNGRDRPGEYEVLPDKHKRQPKEGPARRTSHLYRRGTRLVERDRPVEHDRPDRKVSKKNREIKH